MKCELAKDLIILYAEDLCSKETADELTEHLENCPECANRLNEYKKELEDKQKENREQSSEIRWKPLRPMKKLKRKLVRGRVGIAILCVILFVIVWGLGVLSYGQITNETLSFSVLADTIKIKSVCKDLVKGDTEPFMEMFAYRIEDQYTVAGSKEFNDFEEYVSWVEKDIKTACDYYFEGKDVTVKIQGIDQYSYDEYEPTDITSTDITVGFYEKDELLYEMAFGKVAANRFIVYEVPKNGEPGFTKSLLPYYDASLDICLHYATKTAYNNLVEKKSDKAGAGLALAITKEGTDEEKESYRYQVIEKVQELSDANWYYKEVMYFVDECDKNAGKWIYKVWFMVENQSNGESVIIEQRFHYYEEQLYVMEDSPAVIIGVNGEVSEETETKLLEVFK